MGHHHETVDHRDPVQASISSSRCRFFDDNPAIVRMIPALLFPAQAVLGL
jgi:hypothetical protein